MKEIGRAERRSLDGSCDRFQRREIRVAGIYGAEMSSPRTLSQSCISRDLRAKGGFVIQYEQLLWQQQQSGN